MPFKYFPCAEIVPSSQAGDISRNDDMRKNTKVEGEYISRFVMRNQPASGFSEFAEIAKAEHIPSCAARADSKPAFQNKNVIFTYTEGVGAANIEDDSRTVNNVIKEIDRAQGTKDDIIRWRSYTNKSWDEVTEKEVVTLNYRANPRKERLVTGVENNVIATRRHLTRSSEDSEALVAGTEILQCGKSTVMQVMEKRAEVIELFKERSGALKI